MLLTKSDLGPMPDDLDHATNGLPALPDICPDQEKGLVLEACPTRHRAYDWTPTQAMKQSIHPRDVGLVLRHPRKLDPRTGDLVAEPGPGAPPDGSSSVGLVLELPKPLDASTGPLEKRDAQTGGLTVEPSQGDAVPELISESDDYCFEPPPGWF